MTEQLDDNGSASDGCTSPRPPPYCFISYSHETSAHDARVLDLAQGLRAQGINAWLDRFEPWPSDGWPQWMEDQLGKADFVVAVCTREYRRRFDQRRIVELGGAGVAWEGFLTRSYMYRALQNAQGGQTKFIPLLFGDPSRDALDVVPDILIPFTVSRVRVEGTSCNSADVRALADRLSMLPDVVPLPLPEGERRPRGEREQRTPLEDAEVRTLGDTRRRSYGRRRALTLVVLLAFFLISAANLLYRGWLGPLHGVELTFLLLAAPLGLLKIPAVWREVVAVAESRLRTAGIFIVLASLTAVATYLGASHQRLRFACLDAENPNSSPLPGTLTIGGTETACNTSLFADERDVVTADVKWYHLVGNRRAGGTDVAIRVSDLNGVEGGYTRQVLFNRVPWACESLSEPTLSDDHVEVARRCGSAPPGTSWQYVIHQQIELSRSGLEFGCLRVRAGDIGFSETVFVDERDVRGCSLLERWGAGEERVLVRGDCARKVFAPDRRMAVGVDVCGTAQPPMDEDGAVRRPIEVVFVSESKSTGHSHSCGDPAGPMPWSVACAVRR